MNNSHPFCELNQLILSKDMIQNKDLFTNSYGRYLDVYFLNIDFHLFIVHKPYKSIYGLLEALESLFKLKSPIYWNSIEKSFAVFFFMRSAKERKLYVKHEVK